MHYGQLISPEFEGIKTHVRGHPQHEFRQLISPEFEGIKTSLCGHWALCGHEAN